MKLKGRTAVITGAASGMGRSIALQLAGDGCHLAIADINPDALENVASEIKKKNPAIRVSSHVVDVADRDQVERFAQDAASAHQGKIHLLFANAGVQGP